MAVLMGVVSSIGVIIITASPSCPAAARRGHRHVGINKPDAGCFKRAAPLINRTELRIATAGLETLCGFGGDAGMPGKFIARPAEQCSSGPQLGGCEHALLRKAHLLVDMSFPAATSRPKFKLRRRSASQRG
jgi:hypothetical protein